MESKGKKSFWSERRKRISENWVTFLFGIFLIVLVVISACFSNDVYFSLFNSQSTGFSIGFYWYLLVIILFLGLFIVFGVVLKPKKEEDKKVNCYDEHYEEKHEPDRKALLDSYLDFALAHATMFVAFIFGIFTVLSILNSLKDITQSFWLLSFVYAILFLGGCIHC